MKPFSVFSAFDGAGIGLLSLKRAGIPIYKYYASEVDKYAIQVAKKNHPEIIHVGDVKQCYARNFPKIDLLIGGSPCQDLSIAKANREGLKGARSGLFWHFVRLLRTMKPRYFLLENVASMSKEDNAKITEIMGVEPILINSALVSAQQRKRMYWTNIPGVKQPEDKGMLLKDVLENGVAMDLKSRAIISSAGRTTEREYLKKKQGTMVKTNDGLAFRKLTPVECERLQTWPDGYSEGVSKTQRYKIIGNGWTADVIAHIFSFMEKAENENQNPSQH